MTDFPCCDPTPSVPSPVPAGGLKAARVYPADVNRPNVDNETAPEPTVWGSVADFWEAVRTWEPCPNECGNCRVCAVEWAIGWSVAAESNPEMVERAVQRAADPTAPHRFGAWLT